VKRVMIIDDDRTVCQSLKLLLSKAGHEVRAIYNPLNALETIEVFIAPKGEGCKSKLTGHFNYWLGNYGVGYYWNESRGKRLHY